MNDKTTHEVYLEIGLGLVRYLFRSTRVLSPQYLSFSPGVPIWWRYICRTPTRRGPPSSTADTRCRSCRHTCGGTRTRTPPRKG